MTKTINFGAVGDPSRILVVGKTQSGKSYWAKKLLSQYKNRIVYDIKREYSDYGLIVKTVEELDDEILRGLGSMVGLNLAELDLYLWCIETGKVLK